VADEQINKLDAGNKDSFGSLGISVGSVLTIEVVSSERKYQTHLLGYTENKSIMISPPQRDGQDVLLDKDTVLAVRLLIGKKVCAFQTRIIYRSIQPYTYYHLAYPAFVEALQVRNSERVDAKLHTSIDCDFDIVGEWPKPGFINNLSNSGARLNSSHALGKFGHELILSFELELSGMRKQIVLACIIRNIEHNPELNKDDEERYVFGVQFMDLSDEHRLALSNYIYENS